MVWVSFLSDIFSFICSHCEIFVSISKTDQMEFTLWCSQYCKMRHILIPMPLVTLANPHTFIVLNWRQISLTYISKPVQIQKSLYQQDQIQLQVDFCNSTLQEFKCVSCQGMISVFWRVDYKAFLHLNRQGYTFVQVQQFLHFISSKCSSL